MSTCVAPARVGPHAPQSVAEFARRSGMRSVVIGTQTNPNAKLIVLLAPPGADRPALAIKAPLTDAAAATVRAETAVLRGLRALAARSVVATVPAVVDEVEHLGRPALVMTGLPGRPMSVTYLRHGHTSDPELVAADFDAVGEWLAGLQRATAGPPAPLDIGPGGPLPAGDRAALEAIRARLRHERVSLTAVHGDLWLGNVLVERGQVTGVVDWEQGALRGQPARDLVRFALGYALYLDRRTRPGRRVRGHAGLLAGGFGAGLEYAIDGDGWFPDLFRGFVRRGLARLGAAPGVWRDACLAGIAEIAACADDPQFARDHLDLFRRLTRRPAPKETP